MAVDTAAKRFSALHIAQPWRGVAAFPDGTINNQDRAALSELYNGIGFVNNYLLTALFGSFDWTGYDANLVPTTHINTAAKRYAAIHVGSPWRGIHLFPTGSINRDRRYTLADLYSAFTQGVTYTLFADTGSFVWDGQPSFSDFEISGIAGAFGMTGSDATFIATRTLFASAGTFAMTGNDANLIKFAERTMLAVSGSFSMTGYDASFTPTRRMTFETGTFEMEGSRAELIWANAIGVVHGHPGVFQWGHKVQEIDDDLALLTLATQVLINQRKH